MTILKAENLNEGMFEENKERISTREGYGRGLLEAGEKDPRIVLLSADLTSSTGGGPFAERFPERFIQVGVAEQNLVTVASGMAAMGKIPFTSSYAVFSPGRNWEQIRTTICYNDQPVKIIGSHTGVSVGPDGGTHQALEDIALMRSLPNMTVISPCDAKEAYKATLEIARSDRPAYMRLTRDKTPVMTTDNTEFKIGKAMLFHGDIEGEADVGIIATGPLLYRAIKVARIMEERGYKINVLNLSTIKPLDGEAVLGLAERTGAIVTVEEHQIKGGMGGEVAEFLAENRPVPMEFVGVNDAFGESGGAVELLEKFKMGEEDMIRAIERVSGRK